MGCTPSKSIGGRTRGPPITFVKSSNNIDNDEYDSSYPPKPPARTRPQPAPKPKLDNEEKNDEEENYNEEEGEEENEEGEVTNENNNPDEASLTNGSDKKPAKSAPPPGLAGCKICGRNFAIDRLEKHEAICAKSKAKAKKRKAFDPVKMRTQGTEAEKFVAKGKHLEATPKAAKKADWRKKHEDFIATVRAAKGVKGYKAPPMDTSDYVQCPHCGRKFSEGVADRHIPKCASIQSNKPAAGRRR